MTKTVDDINFYILQLAKSIETAKVNKWIAEIARVIHAMGGGSIVPGKIGRSEPGLRRAGAQIVDEPLDEDMRSGAFKRVLALAENHDVQAYIVHDPNMVDLSVQLKRKKPAPVFFVAQEEIPQMGFLKRRKIIKTLKDVDHIICASAYIHNFFHNELGIDTDRLSVIYEGFDLRMISSQNVSQERTMSLAHSWGAVENVAQLVLVPAVYNDPIWCQNLLRFAEELNKRNHSNPRYVVIGDDDGSGVMNRLSNTLYRTSTAPIQLAGHCADIEAAIKLTSTVLNFYSRLESQFSEALIAQALGRFVFLPQNCPAAHEFIEEGITGKLLPNNVENILNTVENFVEIEHQHRDGNFVSSRSFIMKYFSREEMHKKLHALFEDARFAQNLD